MYADGSKGRPYQARVTLEGDEIGVISFSLVNISFLFCTYIQEKSRLQTMIFRSILVNTLLLSVLLKTFNTVIKNGKE